MAKDQDRLGWYRWHIAKYRNHPPVLRMRLATQGAYRNLLDFQWQNGGTIPNEPDILWKYAMAQSPEEFEEVREEVLKMFTASEDGKYLTNNSLSEEWEEAIAKTSGISKVRSAAGIEGNKKRWNRNPSQTLASESQNIANIAEKRREEKNTNPVSNDPDEDGEEITRRIAMLHPANSLRDKIDGIPHRQKTAIYEAVQKYGVESVEQWTKNFAAKAEATEESRREFIAGFKNPVTFFNDELPNYKTVTEVRMKLTAGASSIANSVERLRRGGELA